MSFFDLFKLSGKTPEGKSSGIFVPDKSCFIELKNGPEGASINAISQHLRYHSDQVYTYLGDHDTNSDIRCIVYELFSKNIVFISTKDTVRTIDLNKLTHFTRNLGDSMFDSYSVHSSLTDGIENQSLTSNFISKVLALENIEPNGIFYADKLGLYLYFTNGLLTDFQSSDGLTHWAKRWKQLNPRIIAMIEDEAKRYWKDDHKQVLNEINVQSDALAKIPQAVDNEFIPLHTNSIGVVNFHMLLVSHYKHPLMVRTL
ncbi:hypothetical protein [Hymenobacter sp. YC55]|uniref:hypothetical protein n=1 Tax=Hymenobacter sp. YC55 TaxID=3034019 RepID=UPI0023F6503C|nr:hypothetical protein [Hymenobacter sp. YC55]MDF7815439.1 hypothetical protein [Hymenobacter sp. YC55]